MWNASRTILLRHGDSGLVQQVQVQKRGRNASLRNLFKLVDSQSLSLFLQFNAVLNPVRAGVIARVGQKTDMGCSRRVWFFVGWLRAVYLGVVFTRHPMSEWCGGPPIFTLCLDGKKFCCTPASSLRSANGPVGLPHSIVDQLHNEEVITASAAGRRQFLARNQQHGSPRPSSLFELPN